MEFSVLLLSLGRTKSLTVFFTPSHQEFIHINKIFLELFLFKLSQWLRYERCSSLLITSVVLHWTLVFASQPCTGEPRTRPSAADGLHQCWVEVEIPVSFSWETDRMHKICRNNQSNRKETKKILCCFFPKIFIPSKYIQSLQEPWRLWSLWLFSRDSKNCPVLLQTEA